MSAFFDAVGVFFDHLAAVKWHALAIALLFHVMKLVVRTFAWRNILRAAFPKARIPRRTVLGAYLGGVGVNSILPARGGDALKLYIVHRGIEGTNYATLASTLVVETLFDLFAAGALFVWALQLGVLPSLEVLPKIPDIDWAWVLTHQRLAAVIGVLVIIVSSVLGIWASRRVTEFGRRLRRGFAVLDNPRQYFTQVVSWQALSWVFRFVSIYWFLIAFGIPATVENTLLVVVVQSLSTLLPLSPGGAGTQQGLAVYVLRGEASRVAILSFSVGSYVTTTAANFVIGFTAILLMLRTVRFRRHQTLRSAADKADA